MRPPNKTVRLVIQEVFESGSGIASYRVIVYPRRPFMRDVPATYSSRNELMTRLQQALPNVDERALAPSDGTTQVLFARELELSDEQLSILGLAH
jgi:hypothetical protein